MTRVSTHLLAGEKCRNLVVVRRVAVRRRRRGPVVSRKEGGNSRLTV